MLSADEFYCTFHEKANSDSFCDFLKLLHEIFGKVLLFADNASYHKSGKVQETLRDLKKTVIIKYLPPYTPELNPVEWQWSMIKKATANTLYKNTDEMKESIRRMLESGEVKAAKMSGYLLV